MTSEQHDPTARTLVGSEGCTCATQPPTAPTFRSETRHLRGCKFYRPLRIAVDKEQFHDALLALPELDVGAVGMLCESPAAPLSMPNALPEPTAPQDGEQTDMIDTLRELEAKATPAPWTTDDSHPRYEARVYCNDALGSQVADCRSEYAVALQPFAREANAALIAAMRNALPDLLSRLSSLSTELARVRGALEKYGRHKGSCNLNNTVPFSKKARVEYYAKGVEGCTCGLNEALGALSPDATTRSV